MGLSARCEDLCSSGQFRVKDAGILRGSDSTRETRRAVNVIKRSDTTFFLSINIQSVGSMSLSVSFLKFPHTLATSDISPMKSVCNWEEEVLPLSPECRKQAAGLLGTLLHLPEPQPDAQRGPGPACRWFPLHLIEAGRCHLPKEMQQFA